MRVSRVVVSCVTALAVYMAAGVPAAVSLSVAFVGVAIVAFMEERLAERLEAS